MKFDELLALANAVKYNTTLVKLDLSNNGFQSYVFKFFMEALVDNTALAHLNVSGNFLDNEFAVDLAHLLEANSILHTVDISKNPIGSEGAKYLLASLLQNNDTLESLGDEIDKNVYMGVRVREELQQILQHNMSSHTRKDNIMKMIAATTAKAVKEKDIDKPNAAGQRP